MPTNRELKEKASALSLALGVKVDLEKNNADLVTLVADLEAQVAAKDGGSAASPATPVGAAPAAAPAATPVAPPFDGADGDLGGPPPVKKAAPAARYPLSVAMGRSITGPRGIVANGAQVRADDYPAEALEELIANGFVIDMRPKAPPAGSGPGPG